MDKTITLTKKEFDELGEYSCSLPTGQTIGKRWKRDLNAFNPTMKDKPADWWMGEYTEHPDPKTVSIEWRRIIPDWDSWWPTRSND